MPKKIENFRPDPKGASKVRDKVALVSLTLHETNLKVKNGALSQYEDDKREKIIPQTRRGISVVETKPIGNIFWVDCLFGFRDILEINGPENSEELFILEATFKLTYKLSNRKNITKNDVASFGILNGPYNAWSYWREYLQNTMLRAGLPPTTLDLMPSPPLIKKR
ncbi:MAG: hypothetical protein KJ921_05290 [Proteobacteria bacterium]|nr:hypothetical protein [Pseudomonadota bacterium]